MFRCCGWKRGDDRGRADLEHHVGYQLPSQFAEEGLAKCWQLDGKGLDVSPEAAVLDVVYGGRIRPGSEMEPTLQEDYVL